MLRGYFFSELDVEEAAGAGDVDPVAADAVEVSLLVEVGAAVDDPDAASELVLLSVAELDGLALP